MKEIPLKYQAIVDFGLSQMYYPTSEFAMKYNLGLWKLNKFLKSTTWDLFILGHYSQWFFFHEYYMGGFVKSAT